MRKRRRKPSRGRTARRARPQISRFGTVRYRSTTNGAGESHVADSTRLMAAPVVHRRTRAAGGHEGRRADRDGPRVIKRWLRHHARVAQSATVRLAASGLLRGRRDRALFHGAGAPDRSAGQQGVGGPGGTVGFGDITPVSQTARAIVIVQMLFDLIIVTSAISIIVGNVRERQPNDAKRPEGGAPPAS
jgi:hypothetical protein